MRLTVVGAVVTALFAVSAGAAMATPHWSDTTHGMKVTGYLEVTTAGQSKKTCNSPETEESTISAEFGEVWNTQSPFNFKNELVFSCEGGGTLTMRMPIIPQKSNSVKLGEADKYTTAPWGGNYTQWEPIPLAVINAGEFGYPITWIHFAETKIGVRLGQNVYATGSLWITTAENGTLTIQP